VRERRFSGAVILPSRNGGGRAISLHNRRDRAARLYHYVIAIYRSGGREGGRPDGGHYSASPVEADAARCLLEFFADAFAKRETRE